MATPGSERIDVLQANAIEEAKKHLETAERFVVEARVKDAKAAVNTVAMHLRHLERLYMHRRGAPRENLSVQIRFLGLWQRALTGVMLKDVVTTPPSQRAVLLGSAYVGAERLHEEHSDSPEYLELFEKIKAWQDM